MTSLHNITFFCRGCHFQTTLLKDIKKHAKSCTAEHKPDINIRKLQLELREYKDIIEANIGIPLKTCEAPENLLEQIRTKKNYNRYIAQMQKARIDTLSRDGLKCFTKKINEDLVDLVKILEGRSFDSKKISSIVRKSGLSGLECRLLFYPGFERTELNVDDLIHLRNMFQPAISMGPFNRKEISEPFIDYRWALLEPEAIIPITLSTLPNNIVYIGDPSLRDAYGFYTLDKVKAGKHYWSMDCRLENFTRYLANHITEFCVHTFRKIYRAVFRNNRYVPQYKKRCKATEIDCTQLFSNLMEVNDFVSFNKFLRRLIIDKATYQPTDDDILNITADDTMQKAAFKRMKSTKRDVIKKLFPGINDQEINDALIS